MTNAPGLAPSYGWNISSRAISVPDLCAIIGEGWDCYGSPTSTGFLLELFKLPRDNATLSRETCDSYLLLPAENTWRYQTRGLLYAFGLFYCFIGLATITAKYMEAMANIVKQTRQVVRQDAVTGFTEIRHEKIWNSTVADITLLALGTSSPQISLSIIDSIQHLGELSIDGLGPGTLVGSAAFNLFPILAVCVLVPKGGVVKRVEKMGVFIVELTWSIWAYVWLYLMLKVSSPNKVTLSEAILTVLQFPLLVLHAYAEDRKWSYISLSFWYKKVTQWVQVAGVPDSKSNLEQSGWDAEHSSSSGYENIQLSMLSSWNERSLGELDIVSSEQAQPSVSSGNYQADGSLATQFLPDDEKQANSPAVILLHQDSLRVKAKNLSLGDKWKGQMYYAMTVQGSTVENGREEFPKVTVLLQHAITIFWRILFAIIIPADVWHGWPTFVCALFCITGISAIAIQLATLLGCVSGISSYIIAITILASGTSWPDLVASKIAVEYGSTADSGIANINTSNCINVFVGIGIPWLIEVCYSRLKAKEGISMQTSRLSFSVIVFVITFILCWGAMTLRRLCLGGELGGPRNWARASSAFFVSLWLAFILLSYLKV